MYYIQRDRSKIKGRLDYLAGKHGFTYNRLYIRNQKTRWGSCSAKNNISLNMRLVALPPDLMDYVILHELIHTRIRNHTDLFWKELLRFMPDAREKSRLLNDYGHMLL